MPILKHIGLLCLAGLLLSGCSCKEWGYCLNIFPNTERFLTQP
jgi:hypothetical protein